MSILPTLGGAAAPKAPAAQALIRIRADLSPEGRR
jgi:hypothetical protein